MQTPSHSQPMSSTHQAVAELIDLIAALPNQVSVVVPAPAGAGAAAGGPAPETLAAQIRQVLANQSQYMGGT